MCRRHQGTVPLRSEKLPVGPSGSDCSQSDDGVSAFLDGLGAPVGVQVSGGESRIGRVDPPAGLRLGPLEREHIERGLGHGVGQHVEVGISALGIAGKAE